MHKVHLRVLALLCLGACDDSTSSGTCTPVELSRSCVEDISHTLEACFVAEGLCSWSSTDDVFVFEWENGARYELTSLSDMRWINAEGLECGAKMPVDTDECDGFRDEVDGRSVETCFENGDGGLNGVRITCDDGTTHRIANPLEVVAGKPCAFPGPEVGGCLGSDGEPFDDGE